MRNLWALLFAVFTGIAAAQGNSPISNGNAAGTATITGGTINGVTKLNNVTVAQLVCDNATDNAAALAALPSGGTIYFPPAANICLTSQDLVATANTSYVAWPGTVTIKATSGNTANPVLMAVANVSNVYVYGLTFDGGGSSFGTANNVITNFTGSNIVYDTVTVQNTRGIGMIFSTSIASSGVRNSTFANVGNYPGVLTASRAQGVAFTDSVEANSHDNFVSGNSFFHIGLDNISMATNTRPTISNNRMSTSGVSGSPDTASSAGIYLTITDGAVVTGNNVDHEDGCGIEAVTITNATITGNGSNYSGGCGLLLATVTGGTISGNTTDNNYRNATFGSFGGINLLGTLVNVTITGNTSTDTQGSKTQNYGIYLQSSPVLTNVRIDPSNALGGNILADISGGTLNTYSSDALDNRVLNPCFGINQPNEGGTVNSGGNAYVSDQWRSAQSGANINFAKSATAIGACQSSELMTVSVQHAPVSGDFFIIRQPIEQQSLIDLLYGTSLARNTIFDYCAKSSIAPFTQGWTLQNTNSGRTYAGQDIIANANTVQCFSHLIPGDPSGAIGTGTGEGYDVNFDLGSGSSNVTGTTGSWIAGTFYGVTGDTPLVNQTAGATLGLSSVRLYLGSRDLGFTQRSYTQELASLQRYYYKTFSPGAAPAQNIGANTGEIQFSATALTTGTQRAPRILFPVQMRVAPTCTGYNPAAANASLRDETAAADGGAITFSNGTPNGINFTGTGNASTAIGNFLGAHATCQAQM